MQEEFYRAVINYDRIDFDGNVTPNCDYILGPYKTPGGAKGAVTSAKKGWPFHFYRTNKHAKTAADRIHIEETATINDVTIEVGTMTWKEYKV